MGESRRQASSAVISAYDLAVGRRARVLRNPLASGVRASAVSFVSLNARRMLRGVADIDWSALAYQAVLYTPADLRGVVESATRWRSLADQAGFAVNGGPHRDVRAAAPS